MQKRGQSSVEYTVLVAFVLVLILPAAYMFLSTSNSDTRVDDAQIQHFAQVVISQSERLSSMGPGAKAVISERLPKGASVELKSAAGSDAYEMVINVANREYVFPSSVPINTSIDGKLTAQGLTSIRIEIKQRPNGEVYSWASVEPQCTNDESCSDEKYCMSEISECALCNADLCPTCYIHAEHCTKCVRDTSINGYCSVSCGPCRIISTPTNTCAPNSNVDGLVESCPAGKVCSEGNCVVTCADGTASGKCSGDKPKKCVGGSFSDDCHACGCPSGTTCQASGICDTKCSDGTSYGQCAATNKPKYCDSGVLVDACGSPHFCGCPAGKICQATTGSCITANKIKAINLWAMYYRILDTPSEQTRFFDILQKENVNTILMGLDSDSFKFFSNDPGVPPNAFQNFIGTANSKGIAVHAVIGEQAAVLDNPAADKPYIDAILKYNIANPSKKFAGIMWDIESASDYAKYQHYIQYLKNVQYNGQTIVSQKLTLSVYADAYDTSVWRSFIREFDIFASNSYQDELTGGEEGGVVGRATVGADICQEEGIRFLIGLETDELEGDFRDPVTLYEEGKDRYHQLESEVDGYFSARYTQFAGQYVHHYGRAIQNWYGITSVSWPSGQFSTGSTVSATVNLRNSENFGGLGSSAKGAELQLRDGAGKIWTTSKIILVPDIGTKSVVLSWTVPSDAINGNYAAKVVIYDLDWPDSNGHRDPLSQVYSSYISTYSLPSYIESMDLTQYLSLVNTYTPIFGGYGRKVLIPVAYQGWQDNSFSVSSDAPPSGLKIVGYLSEESIDNKLNGGADISKLRFDQLTHLLYSGFYVGGPTDPSLHPGWNQNSADQWLPPIVNLAHANGVKVLAVIGCSDDRLASIANNPALLSQFVTNVVNLLNEYNLDGIDIDWEIGGGYQTPMENLITALYITLNPMGKLISEASPPTQFNINLATASKLDLINIMTYDMGPAVWPYQGHSSYDNTVSSMNSWISAGYPKSKLMMGIPFYGRDYQNAFWVEYASIVDNANPSADQNDITKSTGANSYFNSWTGMNWGDPAAHTTYDPDALWWNGPDLVKQKVNYAKSSGLGGVMIWDIGQDKLQDPRSLLQAIYTSKFTLP